MLGTGETAVQYGCDPVELVHGMPPILIYWYIWHLYWDNNTDTTCRVHILVGEGRYARNGSSVAQVVITHYPNHSVPEVPDQKSMGVVYKVLGQGTAVLEF